MHILPDTIYILKYLEKVQAFMLAVTWKTSFKFAYKDDPSGIYEISAVVLRREKKRF